MKFGCLLFTLLFTFFSFSSNCQQYAWNQIFSAPTQHYCGGQSVVTDNAGNVYTTGFYSGNIQLNSTTSLAGGGTEDIYVTKHDQNGNLLWIYNTYTSSNGAAIPTDIKLSPDGSIVIVGYFNTTAYTDFNPNGVSSNLTPGTYNDVFILKLTNGGAFSWVKKVGGFGEQDFANALEIDNSGFIYVVGRFSGIGNYNPDPLGTFTLNSNGAYDGFTLKLASNGSFEWVKQIGGPNEDDVRDVSINSNGNVIVTGLFTGNVDFDSGSGQNIINSNNSSQDIFIVEYSALGNQGNVATIGGSDSDRGYSLDADGQGNVYLSGIFTGNVNFNTNPSGTPVYLFSQFSSAFTLSINSAFGLNWANCFNSSNTVNPVAICVKSNKIYLTGSFIETVDFDPSASNYSLSASSGISDIYIVKMSTNGNFISAIELNSSLFINYPAQFDIDNSNSILLTGHIKGYLDIDPGPNLLNIYGDSYWTAYTLKLSNNCNNTFSVINPITCNPYTAPDGQIYAQSGTYTSNLVNAAGCDSVVTINLTIPQPTTATVDTLSCGTYTSPSGNVWTTNGTYLDTIQNALGCDSILTINLTINTIDTTITKNGNTLSANQQGASYQWYNCTTNSPISGATNQSFTANVPGWYAAMVTTNGCSEMTECIQVKKIIFPPPGGIAEVPFLNEEEIVVYPNPFQDYIKIEAGSLNITKITLYDLEGRKVIETNAQEMLNLEFLASGTYQLSIETDAVSQNFTIVKL
jgi:hypothetical protein